MGAISKERAMEIHIVIHINTYKDGNGKTWNVSCI